MVYNIKFNTKESMFALSPHFNRLIDIHLCSKNEILFAFIQNN